METREVLRETEVRKRLAQLPAWSKNGKAIKRSVIFENFQQGIDFVCIVAELSDGSNHHPDIEIRENLITLYCTTHRAKGITDFDFDLAHKIEDLITETVFEE